MKVSGIIVDDDADSRMILRSFLEAHHPGMVIKGEAATVADGIRLVASEQPQFVLLDISLPDGTGFDLLQQLPQKNFEVIFITAHDQYAIRAFKYAALDYLLKPVSFTELESALQRVQGKISEKYFSRHWNTLSHNLDVQQAVDKRLAIASGNKYFFIAIADIAYLESQSNYTYFHLADGKKLLSSYTLGYYEELLPEEQFIRIHHSCMVHTRFVDCYVREGAGGTVIMKDGKKLNVSQRKKEEVINRLIRKAG